MSTNPDTLNDEQFIADVFGFDLPSEANQEPAPAAAPSEPSVGTEGGAAVETPVPAAAPTSPPAEPAPSAAPVQAPAPQPAVESAPAIDPALEIASLKAQLELASKPATPPAQPEQPQAPTPPAITPVQVQLPQPLIDSIFGEDPAVAAQGLNAMVSGIMTALNAKVEQSIQQALATVNDRFQQQTQAVEQSAAEKTAEELRADYFKTFPAHNNPVLHSIVASEAQQLAASLPGLPWDDKFRDALGARVNQKLQQAGWTGVTGPTTPPTTPPSAPAAMVPTGVRPGLVPADDQMALVAETFSFD